MDEKKIGKYFRYGVGIIVLMILNAVITYSVHTSIQNWNEQRKEQMKSAQEEKKATGSLIENNEIPYESFSKGNH